MKNRPTIFTMFTIDESKDNLRNLVWDYGILIIIKFWRCINFLKNI